MGPAPHYIVNVTDSCCRRYESFAFLVLSIDISVPMREDEWFHPLFVERQITTKEYVTIHPSKGYLERFLVAPLPPRRTMSVCVRGLLKSARRMLDYF